MKSTIVSSIHKNKVITKEFEDDFRQTEYIENRYNIDNASQKGTKTEMRLDGLGILALDLKTEPYYLQVHHDFPLFKLQFEIEGSSTYLPQNNLSTVVHIPGGHYNLFYLPEVKGVLNYKTHYRKTLEIVFTEHYIRKIIGNDFKSILLKLGEAITNQKPFLLWKDSKPITSELNKYIHEILHCKYSKGLKKPYLEAKVNELLIYLLANTNNEDFKTEQSPLSQGDYQTILNLEKHIKNNLKDNITIPELARLAGMNSSKLKYCFKLVFENTIFKHTTKLRMEEAKHLIVTKKHTITEASEKVGYKHPQHFTAAFKKLYGYLPSKLT